MKKIFLILALILSVSLSSQTVNKFERIPNDDFQLHCTLHSFEDSDGNIILMEECFDIINDVELEAKGVNLLKINTKGELIKSQYMDFNAIEFHNPFMKNPFEENNNLMAGFYFNVEDNKYHYIAEFFDNDLNHIETVDVPVELEGFRNSYFLIFDDISNNYIMTYEVPENYACVYVKMDIYGKILNITKSILPEYKNLNLMNYPLFVYNTEPLQYGCFFNSTKGVISERLVVLSENMDVLEIKGFGIEFSDKQIYVGHDKCMVGLNDGMTAMLSHVYDTITTKAQIQLTKFDRDFNVLDYVRFGEGYMKHDDKYESIEGKSVIKSNDGMYVIWTQIDEKHVRTYMISHVDNNFDQKWESMLYSGLAWNHYYEGTLLKRGGLALVGYMGAYDDYGVEDNATICYIIDDTKGTMYLSDNLAVLKPYSIFPNPTKDIINISFLPDVKCEKVQIFGMDGKLYHEQNFDMSTINVDGLSTGIYMMKIQLSSGISYTGKLVVE